MQSSGYDNGDKETLVMCAILKRKSASHLLKESAIQEVHERINKKKKMYPKDRYVAKVSTTRIAFESIEKAKKQYPIVLAEINDIGRIPADPNVFSLQVPQDKKKKREEDGPVLLYLIRFEDSAAVDKFFDALNGNNAHSPGVEGPSETRSLTDGQNTDKHNRAGGKVGARTARNEDWSVRTWKKTDDEHISMRGKRSRRKVASDASEASNVNYIDGLFLGETASDTGVGQRTFDSQWNYDGFSGSDTRVPPCRRRGVPLSRREGKVYKLPAVLQQQNRTSSKQTFIEYQPTMGPTRKSYMVVDPWPGRSHSHRRAYMPPPNELSTTSASSEDTLCCSVTPTYKDVEREQAFREERRRWKGMYKSYRVPTQDCVF
ncbi:unnamed protein product [Dibothriocephalus latus]|uniref:DUF5733 domain-containing protein n=1 Tax=Dibothriocephalus latus TaxID=60516 RepID=A0A3P6V851_DIBLA|nr:unnamed protein product [Dibothriocephalus latus]